MERQLLIIFIKTPILGKVKTRLAATLGKEKALEIYHLLLRHTFKTTQKLPFDKAVFYDGFIDEGDLWDDGDFLKFTQEGQDLGEKMINAFNKGFTLGYKQICIIGSDCHELAENHIVEAFDYLEHNDVVLGPAYDGGYYLLGMKMMIRELFYDKKWSDASVFRETLKNLEGLTLQYALTEKLNDVDEEKDLSDELREKVGLKKKE